MKREDEEFCKSQFDSFVKELFAPSEVVWEEVAPQDEPPDYYLYLSNAKFAVEVTTVMEKIPVGEFSLLPHHVITNILQGFVAKIKTIAENEGCLQGNHLVFFPTPIDDFNVVQDKIQDDLLDYIRSTKGLESAALKIVFEKTVPQQRPQQCRIQKVSNKPDNVLLGGPVWTKWEREAAIDICNLLDESVNTKDYKLRDVPCPKILLLLDEYRFADSEMYKGCVPKLPSLTSFHTVFVVQGDKKGFVLYSQSCIWLRE